MKIYYWESANDYGEYKAASDEVALKLMHENTILLYRESDTTDGMLFVILYEKE